MLLDASLPACIRIHILVLTVGFYRPQKSFRPTLISSRWLTAINSYMQGKSVLLPEIPSVSGLNVPRCSPKPFLSVPDIWHQPRELWTTDQLTSVGTSPLSLSKVRGGVHVSKTEKGVWQIPAFFRSLNEDQSRCLFHNVNKAWLLKKYFITIRSFPTTVIKSTRLKTVERRVLLELRSLTVR